MEPAGDPLSEDLAAGRSEAFAALYDRYGTDLFRVARLLTGSVQDAEDAVQETFVGLVRARASLAGVRNLRAYLFTVLRRILARQNERRGRRPVLALNDVHEIAHSERPRLDADESARLEATLSRLPAEQREVVGLKIDGGLTLAEIAVVLDIPANTAASRYRYALEKLRAALEEQP